MRACARTTRLACTHARPAQVTPVATTNEREDVASANAMLRANWLQPTQWAPVATSHEVKIDGHRWRAVVEGGALAQLLRECYVAWWNASRCPRTCARVRACARVCARVRACAR
eukprot:1233249-Pleurochrysis_carterae.AAC.1